MILTMYRSLSRKVLRHVKSESVEETYSNEKRKNLIR